MGEDKSASPISSPFAPPVPSPRASTSPYLDKAVVGRGQGRAWERIRLRLGEDKIEVGPGQGRGWERIRLQLGQDKAAVGIG